MFIKNIFRAARICAILAKCYTWKTPTNESNEQGKAVKMRKYLTQAMIRESIERLELAARTVDEFEIVVGWWDKQKRIFFLRVIRGCSPQKIAACLEMTDRNVRDMVV
ncbi:MAG: hypothetical protein FWG90_14245 [Oscillospiraceae bacterium]|nr:hypothetical protein [Oscillospiraceae bacterium]